MIFIFSQVVYSCFTVFVIPEIRHYIQFKTKIAYVIVFGKTDDIELYIYIYIDIDIYIEGYVDFASKCFRFEPHFQKNKK